VQGKYFGSPGNARQQRPMRGFSLSPWPTRALETIKRQSAQYDETRVAETKRASDDRSAGDVNH
jgi:hypothetical protein